VVFQEKEMTVKYHYDLEQCSEAWYAARCGLLTASEMKNIITPAKLQYAQNDKEKAHLYELLAQRITKFVEPHYVSDDMMRGKDDELDAKRYYSEHYAPVQDCGFITNDKWGFTLGYSPDGLVSDEGVIEVKSRRQKYHVETIRRGKMPEDFLIQVQTGMLVSERSWCDFISFCGGLPMFTLRITADEKVQKAIVEAASIFHGNIGNALLNYELCIKDASMRLVPTERRPPEKEMHL
jgi:hypothetical protein